MMRSSIYTAPPRSLLGSSPQSSSAPSLKAAPPSSSSAMWLQTPSFDHDNNASGSLQPNGQASQPLFDGKAVQSSFGKSDTAASCDNGRVGITGGRHRRRVTHDDDPLKGCILSPDGLTLITPEEQQGGNQQQLGLTTSSSLYRHEPCPPQDYQQQFSFGSGSSDVGSVSSGEQQDTEPLMIGPNGYNVVDSIPSPTRMGCLGDEDSISMLLSTLADDQGMSDSTSSLQAESSHTTDVGSGMDRVRSEPSPSLNGTVELRAPTGQELAPPMSTRPITPHNVMKAAPLPFTLKELEDDFKSNSSSMDATAAATGIGGLATPPSTVDQPVAVSSSLTLSSAVSSASAVAVPTPNNTTSTSSKRRRFRCDQADQWTGMFNALLQFREKHGHCSVPRTSKKYPLLGRWVKRQRYQYKLMCEGDRKSTMTPERVRALEEIGFVWDSYSNAWARRYEDLKQFVAKHGHANVPSPYPENPQLSHWIKFQRREYKNLIAKKGKKQPSPNQMDRILALEALGFQWELRSTSKRTARS